MKNPLLNFLCILSVCQIYSDIYYRNKDKIKNLLLDLLCILNVCQIYSSILRE